jgi:hypothetical protein
MREGTSVDRPASPVSVRAAACTTAVCAKVAGARPAWRAAVLTAVAVLAACAAPEPDDVDLQVHCEVVSDVVRLAPDRAAECCSSCNWGDTNGAGTAVLGPTSVLVRRWDVVPDADTSGRCPWRAVGVAQARDRTSLEPLSPVAPLRAPMGAWPPGKTETFSADGTLHWATLESGDGELRTWYLVVGSTTDGAESRSLRVSFESLPAPPAGGSAAPGAAEPLAAR